MKQLGWVIWDTPPLRAPKAEVRDIGRFDARGMLCVYGRGDHFTGACAFFMDLWLTKGGRLLARFWSRSTRVEGASVEVVGFSPNLPLRATGQPYDERWVPKPLREAYDEWIDEEIADVV